MDGKKVRKLLSPHPVTEFLNDASMNAIHTRSKIRSKKPLKQK
jgi:hypothetical protein